MRFRGRDINTIHPAVRLSKETPPGTYYDVATVRGTNGEIYAGSVSQRSEYRVTVNVAAKTQEEMMRARAMIAAWGGSGMGRLEPTNWPGMAYDAAIERIDAPEGRFSSLEIVFVLPNQTAYETKKSSASGNGQLVLRVGGTANTRPVIRQVIKKAITGLEWRTGDPNFEILGDRRFLRYKEKLNVNDVIEMDMDAQTLTVNGQSAESGIDYLATNYDEPFAPGKNYVTSNNTGIMEARWHNRWL